MGGLVYAAAGGLIVAGLVADAAGGANAAVLLAWAAIVTAAGGIITGVAKLVAVLVDLRRKADGATSASSQARVSADWLAGVVVALARDRGGDDELARLVRDELDRRAEVPPPSPPNPRRRRKRRSRT